MLEKTLNIEKKIIFDEPMKNHTSFKIGGKADLFIEITTVGELCEILKYAKEKNIRTTIVGNGSNILVTDKGIRGLVIKINIDNLKIEKNKDNVLVTVGAGYKISKLAQELLKRGISGLEELSAIPGTVGGAIFMNAGSFGKEMKDIVELTKCIDLNENIFELSNKEQQFDYRTSIFNKKDYIILEATLKLNYGDSKEIKDKMEKYLTQKREKQPIEYFSAGSSFKRKNGIMTAKLIDECGLKGYQIGGAKVSEKHAGFIINDSNATAKDVLDLIKYVKQKVYEKYGIEIEEEIRIIGEK